jgi:uncharacterized protein YkwD
MIEAIVIVAVIGIVFLCFYNKKIKEKIIYTPIEETGLVSDKELIDLINEHRKSIGLDALKVSSLLCELAEEKAQYMSDNNEASHDYINEYGERAMAIRFAEIVAENYITPKSTLTAYLNSKKGHKEKIETPTFNWVGSATINRFNCVFFATY